MTSHSETSDTLELTEALTQTGRVVVVVERDPDDPQFCLPAVEAAAGEFIETGEHTQDSSLESVLPINAEPFVPAVPITDFPDLDVSLTDSNEIELIIPDAPVTAEGLDNSAPQPSRRAARYELLAGGKTL